MMGTAGVIERDLPALDRQDAGLLGEVLGAYLQFARTMGAPVVATWLALDLSMRQLAALLLLAHREVLSVGGLATHLGISRPVASHLVDQLVQRGLVSRNEDTADRRRTWVRLTTQGQDVLERLYWYQHEQGDLRCQLESLATTDLQALARGLRALAEAALQPE